MATKRRSKGTGCISKTSGGIYYFYWSDANGKRKKKTLRTRNRSEALERAADFEKGITAKDRADVIHEAAKARGIINERQLPFDNVWNEYLATRPTCATGTKENHLRHLTRFINWVKSNHANLTSFTQIDDDLAIDYFDELWNTGISAATQIYHRASLLAITNAIGRKFRIERNPFQSVERKKDEQQTRQALTTGQINELLENTGTDAELYILLMLGAYAGMRLKDAALLQWQDVDLKSQTIKYRPYKTRRQNKIAELEIKIDLLRALCNLDAKPGGYVLPGIAEQYQNNYTSLKKSLLKIIATVAPNHNHNGAMQRVQTRTATGYHGLRHYFCTTCANNGTPLAKVAAWTGDQMKTLGKYYIRGENSKGAIEKALQIAAPAEPERDQLKKLADTLPINEIKNILNYISASQG